jgi:hypothetical protein
MKKKSSGPGRPMSAASPAKVVTPVPAAPPARVAAPAPVDTPRPSASGSPPGNGKAVSPDTVRVRAYEKWEQAGRPESDGVGFWLEAERELLQGS